MLVVSQDWESLTGLINSHPVDGDGFLSFIYEFGFDGVVRKEDTNHNSIGECHGSADPEEALPDMEVICLDESDPACTKIVNMYRHELRCPALTHA